MKTQAPEGHEYRIHAGKVATSKQLQDTLFLLQSGLWLSSNDIHAVTGSIAVGTDISALRANGFKILSRYKGLSAAHRKIWEYKWDPTEQPNLLPKQNTGNVPITA